MVGRTKLVSEFGRFLRDIGPWDLFITITFRNSMKISVAKKSFKQFFKHLNSYEQTFFEKFLICFIVFEKEDNRNGVHIHALIRGVKPLHAELLEKKCRKVFGHTAVLPYNSEKAARFYLSRKYISPDLIDFDFLRINSRLRRKSSDCVIQSSL